MQTTTNKGNITIKLNKSGGSEKKVYHSECGLLDLPSILKDLLHKEMVNPIEELDS